MKSPFAKSVALRYGDATQAYEVWNEPNAFFFWNPVDPVQYTNIGGNVPQSLVNQACLDIQRGRNDVVLIAGGETGSSQMRV